MFSLTIRVYSVDNQSGITFFSLRKHTAVDFINGGTHILLADSALMADEATVDYSLSGYWTKKNLTLHPETVFLADDFEGTYMRKRQNLVSFGGKLLVLWDGSCFSDSLLCRLPADYLLVMGKQNPDVQSVLNGYDAKTLLIDGSVPHYLAEKWIQQADAMDLSYCNLGESAWEVSIE